MPASNALGSQTTGRIMTLDLARELMDVALEGLYIGRDNKALLVARHGMILSANLLAQQLCGLREEDRNGQRRLCDFFNDLPEASPDEPLVRWDSELTTGGGVRIPIEVVREPLSRRLPGVLVYAIRDLRERRAAAAELEQTHLALRAREQDLQLQNLRLATAINNIPQGLALFDQDRRLLVWNWQFEHQLGLLGKHLARGTSIEQVLAASRLASSTANESSFPEGTLQLENGQMLFIMKRPIPDGGIIVTVEDVT